MKIETKYSIGDSLFYIEVSQNVVNVKKDVIKQINIGGKAHGKYQLGYNVNRGEHELYTDFQEAKDKAIKRQEAINEMLIAGVKELKEKSNYNF